MIAHRMSNFVCKNDEVVAVFHKIRSWNYYASQKPQQSIKIKGIQQFGSNETDSKNYRLNVYVINKKRVHILCVHERWLKPANYSDNSKMKRNERRKKKYLKQTKQIWISITYYAISRLPKRKLGTKLQIKDKRLAENKI